MAALRIAKKELRALIQKKLAEVPGESVAEQSIAVAATLLSLPKYMVAKRIGIYLSMPQGEVMTRALVMEALAQDKQVFVPYMHEAPRVFGDGKPRKLMEMVSLHSRDDYNRIESNRDAWGIPSVKDESVSERHKILDDDANIAWGVENYPTDPELTEKRLGFSRGNLDMLVMPGVAFDRRCGRLGHGKGFYDSFLQRYYDDKILGVNETTAPQHRKGMPFLVGLALNEQIVPIDQEVPSDPSDWRLDALITGDGSIVQRPAFECEAPTAENPNPQWSGVSNKKSE